MCNQGSHSRKLAWCETDVFIFSTICLRIGRVLNYIVNPVIAFSVPKGVVPSNNRHISRSLLLCFNRCATLKTFLQMHKKIKTKQLIKIASLIWYCFCISECTCKNGTQVRGKIKEVRCYFDYLTAAP